MTTDARAIRTEAEEDARPDGPICRSCLARLVPVSHGWVCPYDVDERTIYDWELANPQVTLDDLPPHRVQVLP